MQYYLIIPDSDVYDFLKISSDNSLEIIKSISGEKIGSKWLPVPVDLVKMKLSGDFPSMSGLVTFSEKAWRILEPIIKEKVETLSLLCKEGLFYAINILDMALIDLEKAEVKRFSDGEIIRIKKYAFKKDTVVGKQIFTPKGLSYSSPIVSETFKEIVEKNELKGLIFKKVWELGDYNI